VLLPSLGCLIEGFWENRLEGEAPGNENSKSLPVFPSLNIRENTCFVICTVMVERVTLRDS
jgi:hypothetical protein